MSEDKTIIVDLGTKSGEIFDSRYALSVTKDGTGFGSVTVSLSSATAISCGPGCLAIPHDAVISLTANPNPGSTFTSWGGACSGSSPVCRLTMNSDKAVTATFTSTTINISTTPTPPTPDPGDDIIGDDNDDIIGDDDDIIGDDNDDIIGDDEEEEGASTKLRNPINVPDFPTFIKKILDILLTIAVPVIAIFIIYSGFLFVSAQGNSEKLVTARTTFLWTIIGAAVVLGAWVIAQAIGNTVEEIRSTVWSFYKFLV